MSSHHDEQRVCVHLQTALESPSSFVLNKKIIQANRDPLLSFLGADELLGVVHDDADCAKGPHLDA